MIRELWHSIQKASSSFRQEKKLPRGRGRSTLFHSEYLERRVMLSANQIYYMPTLSAVIIEGTSGNDTVNVWTDTSNTLHISMQNATGTQFATFNTSEITQVRFTGGDGDDVFTNTTSIASLALGENGNDILSGGSGDDFLDGGAGDDQLYGNAGNDQLYGRDGNDVISGDVGNDILEGGTGNDSLYGGDGDDMLYGEDGNDSLSGGLGNDYVDGGTGNDTLHGDAGDDTLHGGDGDDNLYGDDGADLIYGDNGNDFIQGGTGNDTLLGGAGNDTITGDDGNDILYGEADGDWLSGGAGNDYVDGGAGNNNLYGGDGDDTLVVADGFNRLYGEAGNDTLTGGTGNDLLDGGTGNDKLYGNAGDDTLIGGDGNDTLYGEDGNDSLQGGTGDDVLDGGTGNDTLDGGAGNDTLSGDDGNDVLYGMDGTDTLSGGAGNDLLDGGTGNDKLYGGTGNDSLYGGDGDDMLYGEDGNDSLSGGLGNDYVDGGTGNDTLHGDAGDDTLHGGDGDDNLYGDDGADLIYGDNGNDFIQGGTGNDTLLGGAGNDTITGDDGNDILYGEADGDWLSGGAGNDYVDGGAGNNNLYGGDGDDTLVVADGFNRLYGEAGNDTLTGGTGNDLLDGGTGNDKLYGNAGDDTLIGGDGNDTLYGEDGNDSLQGGTGDDVLDGGTGNDTLDGGAGNDTLSGDDGNDALFGSDGNDRLDGGAGDDTLHGGTGDDTLIGDDGNDYLYGDDGNDTLYGNAGNDLVMGGAGDDTLYGEDGNDVLIGGLGKDQLNGGDGDDFLLGGSTAYDQNAAALQALMAGWTTSDPYATRVQAISDQLFSASISSGDDPSEHYTVAGAHVIDDQASDSLTGGNGQDWFFETGNMPMWLPSDVVSDQQQNIVNGDSLVQCGEQVMLLTSQVPTDEGFALFNSLDTFTDRQTSENQTSLVPESSNVSLEQEHLALMQLVRYDQVTNYAIHSGNWSDPTIWHGGVVPADGANVLIPVGVEVQVDGMIPARLKTVRVDGTLTFNTTHNTQLQVDTLVVSDCGDFHMGTADNPIASNVTAKLLITDNGAINRVWDPYGISRGLISQGSVSIYGSEVSSYEAIASGATIGSQAVTLKAAPVGWKAGDELVFAATDGEGTTQNEVRHVLLVLGNQVYFDQPLAYNHVAPEADLNVQVANVTRNAVITSEATSFAEYGHVMFMHNKDVHIAYGGFYHLGRTDKSVPINDPVVLSDGTLKPGTGTNPRARYAVHFHREGTVDDGNPATIIGSAVVDSPGWGYDNHSSYVDMTDNVAFDVNGAGFVTEVGDEIGGFYDNLAIGISGTGEAEVMNNRLNVQDFGFQGDGFWLQGAGVSMVGNISAGNTDNAFVIYTQGLIVGGTQLEFSSANLDDPSLAQGLPTIPVNRVPIKEFSDNEGYASYNGLVLRYHLQATTLDEHSVIQDSSFWNNELGVYLPYTENTTLLNLKVINGMSHQPFIAINGNIATKNDNYENLTVSGYYIGIVPPRHGTSIISGGSYNDVDDVLLYTAATEDRTIYITNMPANFTVTTVLEVNGFGFPVDIFFVKDTIILNYGPYVNQQLYFVAQEASAIPFPDPRSDAPSKYIGLTNQQLWDQFGVALGGKIAPASAGTFQYLIGVLAPVGA